VRTSNGQKSGDTRHLNGPAARRQPRRRVAPSLHRWARCQQRNARHLRRKACPASTSSNSPDARDREESHDHNKCMPKLSHRSVSFCIECQKKTELCLTEWRKACCGRLRQSRKGLAPFCCSTRHWGGAERQLRQPRARGSGRPRDRSRERAATQGYQSRPRLDAHTPSPQLREEGPLSLGSWAAVSWVWIHAGRIPTRGQSGSMPLPLRSSPGAILDREALG
jgi:hypothetical protein